MKSQNKRPVICGQVETPTVDNSQVDCLNISNSKCTIITYISDKIKNLEDETLNDYLEKLDEKLSNQDNTILNLKRRIEKLENNA